MTFCAVCRRLTIHSEIVLRADVDAAPACWLVGGPVATTDEIDNLTDRQTATMRRCPHVSLSVSMCCSLPNHVDADAPPEVAAVGVLELPHVLNVRPDAVVCGAADLVEDALVDGWMAQSDDRSKETGVCACVMPRGHTYLRLGVVLLSGDVLVEQRQPVQWVDYGPAAEADDTHARTETHTHIHTHTHTHTQREREREKEREREGTQQQTGLAVSLVSSLSLSSHHTSRLAADGIALSLLVSSLCMSIQCLRQGLGHHMVVVAAGPQVAVLQRPLGCGWGATRLLIWRLSQPVALPNTRTGAAAIF